MEQNMNADVCVMCEGLNCCIVSVARPVQTISKKSGNI